MQALMDLALPRFAGLTDGPRQVHLPWSVAADSPASPAPIQLDPSWEESSRCSMDQMLVSSTYLNLDVLSSSSEEELRDEAKCSDLSVTLLCSSSEEAGTLIMLRFSQMTISQRYLERETLDSSSGGVPVRRAV